jgi:hypothetical protein
LLRAFDTATPKIVMSTSYYVATIEMQVAGFVKFRESKSCLFPGLL